MDAGQTKVERKLVTVLAADFVNFSRLMGGDEESTAGTLQGHRETIDGIIRLHGGRIFNTGGDSVFAEFSSPVESVRAALEIQEALRTRNDNLPEARRLLLRIGINLGDVIVRGDDFLGDAVNVAARLEGIAEPGGVLISGSVHDQIAGKLNMSFQPLGTPKLKNIARPISIFSIVPRSPNEARANPKRRRWKTPLLAAAVLLIGSGVGWSWWASRPARNTPSVLVATKAPASDTAERIAAATKPTHWLNGTWAMLLTRQPVSANDFCSQKDPRCRFLTISAVSGDGSFEGSMGYSTERMSLARFTVTGHHVSIVTPSNSIVEADLGPDGLIRGRMETAQQPYADVVTRKLSD